MTADDKKRIEYVLDQINSFIIACNIAHANRSKPDDDFFLSEIIAYERCKNLIEYFIKRPAGSRQHENREGKKI